MNNTSFEAYLRDGCGRCERYQTPECKVHRWTRALVSLRELLLSSGLVEAMKWGSPCYTLGGKNVVMLMSFNDSCALQFFKGAALVDESGLLESPGPNSRFGRMLRFRSVEEVAPRTGLIQRLLEQAIALEVAGLKVVPSTAPELLPLELEARLSADPALRRAFDALTPGRRRSHLLHISGAKQSETRQRRVERCALDILAGRGWAER